VVKQSADEVLFVKDSKKHPTTL